MKRIAIAATLTALAGAAAYAHSGATGVVKERMDQMKAVAASMKTIGQMMKGETEYSAETVAEEARKIAAHGGETLTKVFPEGSLDHPSESLPTIWENWDRFEALAADLTFYAEGLAAAAGNERGAMGMPDGSERPTAEELAALSPEAAFASLGRSCSACHEDFRQKKD